MLTKQQILDEIRHSTEKNGGSPLGEARFERETGINSYDWGKFWARFGDAQKEAGFTPNQFKSRYYNEDFFIEKIIGLTRKLGKFPTSLEVRVEKSDDPEFPSKSAFQRRGTKEQVASKVIEYCNKKSGYDDVIKICQSVLVRFIEEKDIDSADYTISEVYLFKSGRYYKIGKTNDTVRRGKELRVQLPEKSDLIHSIKTDDPSGIESYWHKRFESKRMNGEWFDLKPSDIKAFKRWRRIV